MEFKKGIGDALRGLGFTFSGKTHVYVGKDATILIGFSKGFGEEWFIDVGFWIASLDSDLPKAVEKTHMYFRLERLFPDSRELILTAGSLDERNQPQAFAEFLTALRTHIGPALQKLGTADGLKAAYVDGRLTNGLVTQRAREFLEGL